MKKIKMWMTRDNPKPAPDLNTFVELWVKDPGKKSKLGRYWGDADLTLSMCPRDFRRQTGFLPRKGSKQCVEITIKRLKKG